MTRHVDPRSARPARPYAPWSASWCPTLALVGGVTVARLVYLAFFCPYALVEDEAHYWEWSRHLGWSYYSKGPGVAWAIAAATRLVGTSEFGVRLPAALFGGVTALAVAGLARDALGDRRAGFFAAVLFLLTPLSQMSAILMTIDGPYMACWALAAWAGWRALARGSGRAWVGLGAALAAGFLFKYTIVLLVPGLAFFAWRGAAGRRAGAGWIGAGAVLALLGLAPVAVWNAGHDWATVRHLLGHVGFRGGDMPDGGGGGGWSPLWMLSLIGSQFGLLGVPALLCIYAVWEALRGPADAGRRYMLCVAAPILLFYLAVSLVAEPEGNWPAAGHLTLIALAGWATVSGMDEHRRRVAAWMADPARPWRGLIRRRPEMPRQMAWDASIVVGLVFGVGFLRLDVLAHLPLVGPLVPVGRLTSAREVAAGTEEVLGRLRRQGERPFVVAQHYGRASQLAFYLPGRPVVYCSSGLMGGRPTQHDFWRETDLRDLAALGGRAAVMLGASKGEWEAAFESVEAIGRITGDHKKDRVAFIGRGYRGFPAEGTER